METGIEDLGFSHRTSKHKYHHVRCIPCERKYLLRRNRIDQRSCGCVPGNYRHGHDYNNKRTPELRCYHKIKERCGNPTTKGYENYGGRGIKVCDRWVDSFDHFLEDMGERPSKKHSIERIDVNRDYKPSNCKWATKLEQSRNTRTNRYITHQGQTKCLAEWLEITGTSKSSFYRRVNRNLTELQALGLEK